MTDSPLRSGRPVRSAPPPAWARPKDPAPSNVSKLRPGAADLDADARRFLAGAALLYEAARWFAGEAANAADASTAEDLAGAKRALDTLSNNFRNRGDMLAGEAFLRRIESRTGAGGAA